MKVNIHNVKECWELYEAYKEEFRKENYSDASYEDFEKWCLNELFECPNCGVIQRKEDNTRLDDSLNPDNVCDYCIEELDYGK